MHSIPTKKIAAVLLDPEECLTAIAELRKIYSSLRIYATALQKLILSLKEQFNYVNVLSSIGKSLLLIQLVTVIPSTMKL